MEIIIMIMVVAVFVLSGIYFTRFYGVLEGVKSKKAIETFLDVITAFCLAIIIMGLGMMFIVI